jgi:hypothetical protein
VNVPGTVRRDGLTVARALLALGLIVSGIVVAAIGGWTGLVLGAGQVAMGTAALLWPRSSGPLGGALLFLVPVPLEAARRWTNRLPLTCPCVRSAHPPALVSVTGLAVVLDLALIAVLLHQAARQRRGAVGRSSP